MGKFVLCFSADIAELRNNKLFDEKVAARFPGAMWVSHLKRHSRWPIEFLTADVALARLDSKLLDANNILIIQHNLDSDCEALVSAGARIFLLTMFESPLYAPAFYRSIAESSTQCRWLMTFEALGLGLPNTLNAYFPSFSIAHLDRLNDKLAWGDRQHASMVVANKYVLTRLFSVDSGPIFMVWWLMKAIRQWLSGNPNSIGAKYAHFQLQDRRLEIIEALLKRAKLDLFGAGWDKLYRIPPDARKRIAPLIKTSITTVSDKRTCLSQYKFNICFENYAAPSYVTEKIFDAMLSGTVPVYFGAQDIGIYVPASCFVDASSFATMNELADYLEKITESEALAIIAAGQEFLRSDLGLQYSYEAMAARVAAKLDEFFQYEAG